MEKGIDTEDTAEYSNFVPRRDWMVSRIKLPINRIICGDCEQVLRDFPDNSIDLIITSPPYADARKKAYGGIHPGRYVDWFLPKAEQFLRMLRPTGTFILNIKEKVVGRGMWKAVGVSFLIPRIRLP